MIGQYQTVTIKFIRDNHSEMNQKNILTSFSKEPATFSSSTTTKKRSYIRKSDAETPEQFPIKMFNVELLLSSNQVEGSQGKIPRDKEQMGVTQQFQQFQKRIKQMKRTILNKIEKFEHRYLKDDFEMDQTKSVQILKELRNIKDRFNILENEVDTLNFF